MKRFKLWVSINMDPWYPAPWFPIVFNSDEVTRGIWSTLLFTCWTVAIGGGLWLFWVGFLR